MSAFTLVYTRALKIYKSDNALIPTPNLISSGTTTTVGVVNKLICTTGNFITKGVSAGDVVFNTSSLSAGTVVSVDSESQLTLNTDLMGITTQKTFRILANNDFTASSNKGCYLYVGALSDVSVVTIGGDTVTFAAVPAGTILPVQIKQLNDTSTTGTSFIALW